MAEPRVPDDVPGDDLEAAVRRWADDIAAAVPPVTVGVARRRAAGHHRTRLATFGVAAALVLVVAGLVWAAATRRDPGRRVVPAVANSTAPTVVQTTGTASTVPAVDGAPVTATMQGSGDIAGIEVTIETPREAVAGTRLPIAVTVTNRGDHTIYWEAGGCAIPVEVTAGPAGVTDTDARVSPQFEDTGWDGDLATLAPWIERTAGAGGLLAARPAAMTGWLEVMCTADSKMRPFAPGEQLAYDGSVELRVAVGALPNDGAFQVVAAFTAYAEPGTSPGGRLGVVAAQSPVTIVDDPARDAAPVAGIVKAVVDDGRLAAWLPTTVIPGRPDLVQDFHTGMSWWRGAWELWVRPRWSSGGPGGLRLRVDPATLTVGDARVVLGLGPPDDEPDGVDAPGGVPDEVLAPPGSATSAAETRAEPAVVRSGDQLTVTPGAAATDACADIAHIYAVTDQGAVEQGALVRNPDGSVTWATPPEGSPLTIPPCRNSLGEGSSTYTVPALAPGSYLVCLTRTSDACAPFEVVA